MAYELTEQKKVGLGLIGFGFFFTFLGVILFFDRGLLALGNIFWLAGVALLLGWRSTWNLFTNRANYKVMYGYIDAYNSSEGCSDYFLAVTDGKNLVNFQKSHRDSLTIPGSASFLLGLFFIFVRWPIIGILLEIFGCFILFGGFWPSIKGFLYQIPVLGWILSYPIMILESLWRGSG